METKNIHLINAEEVSHLFQTKYDNSSFIRVLSGEEQINLATAISSANEIVQGEQLEIKIGESYLIELDDFSSEIELELKNLGWGLILFINGEAYYLRVNTKAQESEFEAIKNYPSLRIVEIVDSDFNTFTILKEISKLTNLTTLNFSLGGLVMYDLEIISQLTNLLYLRIIDCQYFTSIKGISNLKNLKSLVLIDCQSINNLEDISCLTDLTHLKLMGCSELSNLGDLSSLKKIKSLNLNRCHSLKDIDQISRLTNLSKLNLNGCISITNLKVLSNLKKIKNLKLSSCNELQSIEGISNLTNLSELDLGYCSSLKSIKDISNSINLIKLNLSNCTNLQSIEGISDLTNLIELDLSCCSSLRSIEDISNLTNLITLKMKLCSPNLSKTTFSKLTKLNSLDLESCNTFRDTKLISNLINLENLNLSYTLISRLDGLLSLVNLFDLKLNNCSWLRCIKGISSLENLRILNLKKCLDLKTTDGISGLKNLSLLYLNECSSLNTIEGISFLYNLTWLDLSGCISLKEMKNLNSLKKIKFLNFSNCDSLIDIQGFPNSPYLTSINMNDCKSLRSIEGISGISSLISLNLGGCISLIFTKKLNSLPILEKLELKDSSNIRDFDELIHCPNLKEVSWIHEATCSYVLTGSAVRRGDSLFIEEKIKGWVNDLQFSKNPIAFANELITAVGLIENQSLAKEQLIHLANLMRERGLADGESGNAFNTTNWELWLEAVMRKGDAFQEILDLTTQNINAERELEVFAAPILSALADITILYLSAKEWAINFVKELVAPFKENEDWARTIAPAAAVFYAGMELQEEVTFWLNKGTHPHIPKWKDTILLALATYYAQNADYTNSRKYLKNITLPDVQDQGRVLLAKAMSVHFSKEALEEFVAINDVVLQTALAKQLALEPSILASSEGLYQILLCLEQTPALFSEFVSNVLEKQPSSQFVQSIEVLFAKPTEKNRSATAFLALCNEPTVIENIGKLSLEAFKNELQEEVNKERIPLVEDFVSTLIEKELINEKFRKKFQHDLTTNL